jgi:hypothetical protein
MLNKIGKNFTNSYVPKIRANPLGSNSFDLQIARLRATNCGRAAASSRDVVTRYTGALLKASRRKL